MKLRLGVVPYLNALPLYWTLRNQVEIISDYPARLAARLQNGEFDAALMPVADYLRGTGDGLLGDGIVGATHGVRSVLLFHRKPIQEIESIALDTSSHSSVTMLRVMMADHWKIWPHLENHAPNLDAMLARCDAALLIGDPALEAAQREGDWQILDTAREWHNWTGKSFVYAAWAAREGLTNRDSLEGLLNEARDTGERAIPEIAAHHAGRLPASLIESYLTEAIEFHRTPAHSAGLAEFGERIKANIGFLTYPGWKADAARFMGSDQRLETTTLGPDDFADSSTEEFFTLKRGPKADYENPLHFLVQCGHNLENAQTMPAAMFWEVAYNYANGLKTPFVTGSQPPVFAAWQLTSNWDGVAALGEGDDEYFFFEWYTTA